MKVVTVLHKSIAFVLVVIMALQAVLLMASVFFRYILNSPIVWGDEIVRYSLIWMTFVGAALATKDKQHIQVDVIDLILHKRGKTITNVLADVIVVGFMVFLIGYGIRMTDYQRGMFGETLSWFSYAYVYVSIPIGAFLTIVFTITKYLIPEEPSSGEEATR